MTLPPYETFPEIVSDSIILRQIRPVEIKDILEISFYDAKQARTEQEALDMLNKINEDYQNGTSIHWGIVDKGSHTIVGTCGYYRGLADGTGELGCILRPAFRGQGFMTAAIERAVKFGLDTIGLNRIIAITTTDNEKAVKLLARLNFKKTTDLEDKEVEYQYFGNPNR